MVTITEDELKSNLAGWLDKVEAGEVFLISRNGHVVARISPEKSNDAAKRHADAIAGLKQIREELRAEGKAMTRQEILELRNEGRR